MVESYSTGVMFRTTPTLRERESVECALDKEAEDRQSAEAMGQGTRQPKPTNLAGESGKFLQLQTTE